MKKMVSLIFLVICLFLTACGGQQSQQISTPQENKATEAPQGNNQQPEAAKNDYPQKQITLIIQAAPGGSSDTVSRAVAKQLEEQFKVPVVPVNKTGAAGAVAMSFLEASPKDGYTIGYVPVELSMVKAMGYADIEPSKFDLLGRATILPATVTVPVNAPYNTIEEFIDYAKKNPGKIRMGNSGAGSIWHIAAAGFAKEAGIELAHIPFEGAAPAVTALMGGHIDAVPVSPSEVKSGVDGKKLKVLAVMGSERDKLLPDVPTLKEKGIQVEITAWGGFAVPKDTPQEVKKVLTEAIKAAIESNVFKDLAEKRNMTIAYQSPEEFTKFAGDQFGYFSQLIPEMKLK